MGAFDTVPNIVIPDPDKPEEAAAFRKKWGWEAHEQVMIKGLYTSVEQEAVENAGSIMDTKAKQPVLRAGSARSKLLEVMIVDWTLAQDGRRVDIRPETIRRLPANYRTPILEKCDEIAAGMTEEDQAAFLPSQNGHTPASSDGMNLSPLPS